MRANKATERSNKTEKKNHADLLLKLVVLTEGSSRCKHGQCVSKSGHNAVTAKDESQQVVMRANTAHASTANWCHPVVTDEV